jgi:hypothetical protein
MNTKSIMMSVYIVSLRTICYGMAQTKLDTKAQTFSNFSYLNSSTTDATATSWVRHRLYFRMWSVHSYPKRGGIRWKPAIFHRVWLLHYVWRRWRNICSLLTEHIQTHKSDTAIKYKRNSSRETVPIPLHSAVKQYLCTYDTDFFCCYPNWLPIRLPNPQSET